MQAWPDPKPALLQGRMPTHDVIGHTTCEKYVPAFHRARRPSQRWVAALACLALQHRCWDLGLGESRTTNRQMVGWLLCLYSTLGPRGPGAIPYTCDCQWFPTASAPLASYRPEYAYALAYCTTGLTGYRSPSGQATPTVTKPLISLLTPLGKLGLTTRLRV